MKLLCPSVGVKPLCPSVGWSVRRSHFFYDFIFSTSLLLPKWSGDLKYSLISNVFLKQTSDYQTLHSLVCSFSCLLLPWSSYPSVSVSHICFSYLFFLVACYATLHPALCIGRSVGWSVGHTLLFLSISFLLTHFK